MYARLILGAALAWAAGMASSADVARPYPYKPIRIVTAEPGGGTDITLRMVTPALAAQLGQPVIVENRGGGGGVVATEIVVRAAPDGYTLLYYTSALWLAPFLRDNVGYDPVKSFAPVILIVNTPSLLVVHPSVAAHSVKELVTLARARPGELNYGAGGAGTAPHLMAEMFKRLAGVDIMRVPYKGVGLAINDLLAGRVQVVFATASAVAQHVKAGKLRALAVTGARPSALNPGLPTIAATVPGYNAAAMFGLWAPAGTSTAVVARLNREIAQLLTRQEIKERFSAAGIETSGGPPSEFAAIIKSEMATVGKLIREAGIRAD